MLRNQILTSRVAYVKREDRTIYFDSFGNFRPPKELVQYLKNDVTRIEHNHTSYRRSHIMIRVIMGN